MIGYTFIINLKGEHMGIINKNGYTSSQIAKERLKSLQAESRQEYTGSTDGYVENQVSIDNNMFWEGDHNILSSKGD